jgi:methyl-accepting chemotaxis protein
MTDRRRIEYQVGVNDQQFTSGSQGIIGRLRDMAGGFGDTSTMIGRATQAFGIMGAALGARQMIGWAGDAIQLAAGAEEVRSKFEAVFGPANDLKQILSEWGDLAGVTETKAYDLAASFGNLAMAQGISEDATQDLVVDVATLAGDIASFNDVEPAQVFEDLNKALLTTEREGMKKYGIAISENEVKTLAAARAAREGRDAVTEADRALASYEIVVRQAGKANGDLARTADSTANKQRQLKAEMAEFQEAIGQELLPVMHELTGSLLELAPLLSGVAKGFGASITPVTGMSDAVRIAKDESKGFWEKLGDLNIAALKIVSPLGSIASTSDDVTKAVKEMSSKTDNAASSSDIMWEALQRQGEAANDAKVALYELAEAQTANRKSIEDSYVAYASQEAFFDRLEKKLRAMQGIRAPWADWGPPPAYYGDSQYNPGPLQNGQQQANNGSQWNAVNGGPV